MTQSIPQTTQRQTEGKSNFDVLKQMSAENRDIRLFSTVASAQTSHGAGRIEIVVNPETINDLIKGKVKIALLVWDIAQFDAIKIGG